MFVAIVIPLRMVNSVGVAYEWTNELRFVRMKLNFHYRFMHCLSLTKHGTPTELASVKVIVFLQTLHTYGL